MPLVRLIRASRCFDSAPAVAGLLDQHTHHSVDEDLPPRLADLFFVGDIVCLRRRHCVDSRACSIGRFPWQVPDTGEVPADGTAHTAGGEGVSDAGDVVAHEAADINTALRLLFLLLVAAECSPSPCPPIQDTIWAHPEGVGHKFGHTRSKTRQGRAILRDSRRSLWDPKQTS